MRRLPRWCIGLIAAVVPLAGCGDDGATLQVSAASSLKAAFASSAQGQDDVRLGFAGSDELAAQIRAGGRPGLLAAANEKLPAELFRDGLVERPVPFASNRLVVAVPARGARVRSFAGLAAPGVKLAVGAPSVPIGSYAEQVLAKLPPAEARAIRANVRSREPDVAGVVGKVALGAVDAGIVYASDVRAAAGRLHALALPAGVQPRIVYAAAVVRGSGQEARARRFLAGLRAGPGAAALRRAGLAPPP